MNIFYIIAIAAAGMGFYTDWQKKKSGAQPKKPVVNDTTKEPVVDPFKAPVLNKVDE